MRLIITILAVLLALIGLTLSILPFGPIALIPIILAFILGIIAFKLAKKEGSGLGLIKLIFLVVILGLGMTIYRAIFDENVVADDIETMINEEESLEEAKEELEGINIDN